VASKYKILVYVKLRVAGPAVLSGNGRRFAGSQESTALGTAHATARWHLPRRIPYNIRVHSGHAVALSEGGWSKSYFRNRFMLSRSMMA